MACYIRLVPAIINRIQPQHALIENNKNSKVTLKPCPGAKILLNGNEIKDKKELHHHDR